MVLVGLVVVGWMIGLRIWHWRADQMAILDTVRSATVKRPVASTVQAACLAASLLLAIRQSRSRHLS